MNTTSLGSGLVLLLIGCLLLRTGLTKTPVEFNPFNPWRKPLPVWATRLIHIPLALMFLYYGVRNLLGALWR
jgi:hypothetical protein